MIMTRKNATVEEIEELIKKYEVNAFFRVDYYEIPSGFLTESEKYPAGSLDMESLKQEINKWVGKALGSWGGYIGNPGVALCVEFYCVDENKETYYLASKYFWKIENDHLVIDGLADYVMQSFE